jgi:type II secretion system protein H
MAPEAGMTALELLVALGVAALIASVAVPWFGGVAESVEFRTGARALAAELRAARGEALRVGAPVAVVFDPAGRAYGRPDTGAWASLPERLALRWEPEGAPGAPLVFFPDGSATGGTLWLAGPRQSAGIAFDRLTGRSLAVVAGP